MHYFEDAHMAKLIGEELTADLQQRLGGQCVDEHTGQVILIHTVDRDGFPHPAVLSYFEVVARDSRNIRLATYKTSLTTQNMRPSGKVTLSIFDERVTYYLKGIARELRHEMRAASHNSMINVAIEQVLTDRADPVLEPGAYIASGITAVNPHPETERNRYEAILKELSE